MIYIFDIDGTLADLTHRLHFIQQKPADWKSFFAACDQDKPIQDIIDLAKAVNDNLGWIILVTGRSDECREATIEWLHRNEVPFEDIYMREEGDHRQDNVVKEELLNDVLKDWGPPSDEIGGVFEDRQQVVDMYRSKGLRVFQVAKGDF